MVVVVGFGIPVAQKFGALGLWYDEEVCGC